MSAALLFWLPWGWARPVLVMLNFLDHGPKDVQILLKVFQRMDAQQLLYIRTLYNGSKSHTQKLPEFFILEDYGQWQQE